MTAMVSGVEKVELGRGVTVDMETLAQYDGKGECRMVWLWGQIIYREQVNMWTKEMGWKIRRQINGYFTLLER